MNDYIYKVSVDHILNKALTMIDSKKKKIEVL